MRNLRRKIRLSFLNRLERDSPEYFTCYGCCVLHKYDNGAKNFGVSGPVVQQISLHRFSCMRTRNGQFIPEMAILYITNTSSPTLKMSFVSFIFNLP